MGLSFRLRKPVKPWFNPCSLGNKDFFCLLEAAYRGMEQFSRWAKLRRSLRSVVLFLVEKKKLLPYLALRPELMLMGKNNLVLKGHQAQEYIPCWGSGFPSDCSCLKNRLEKCWCFGCSELFPEQFDSLVPLGLPLWFSNSPDFWSLC